MIQENFYLFCRLMTSQSFYLRQKLRGDRRYAAKAKTSLFGAKLSTRLRFLPCNDLCLFEEPDTLLLAVYKFNLNRIQYTPIIFKDQFFLFLPKSAKP